MKGEGANPLLGRTSWRTSSSFWARRDFKSTIRALLVLSLLLPLIFFLFKLSPSRNNTATATAPSSKPKSKDPVFQAFQPSPLQAQFFPEHGSRRAKVRSPARTVPSVSVDNGMYAFNVDLPSPCGAGDCLVTWMHASLEFPDGTSANADNGLWLHHVLLRNMALTAPVCTKAPDTFFGSGNERTVIDLTLGGTEKFGYYLSPASSISAVVELMNSNKEEREAVLTFSYEYIPGPIPPGFSRARVFMLNINGCRSPEAVGFLNQSFQMESPPWTNEVHSGRIIFMGGHVHDGGTHLQIFKNGAPICDIAASYGQSPEFISPPANGAMEIPHISNMATCPNVGTLAINDTMAITAYYDTTQYTPMVDTDGTVGVMGLVMFYVAEGNGEASAQDSFDHWR